MTNTIKLLRKASPYKLQEEMFIQKIGLISIGVALIIISLIISLFVLYTKQKIQKDLIVNGVALTDMVANYSATGLDKVETEWELRAASSMA
jgi:hypothetical protein